ncbi:hypothetical protein HHK36_015335 [Tetracentron sinense]|uniref:NAC domain-containing protein n=1 Tax=Tetracentron sinense TaxID=13715 RepID=A0A834Z2V9_TETSI|nr:hypothetical protein HHK36_015335 [Tetracentron sinense]
MDEKVDEVILPGFRFHPTDEELVGFYLKRKIQQRPLPIDLIKQLDIYKSEPWDLPMSSFLENLIEQVTPFFSQEDVATTGEKEWYFYCPRDRKYRNSSRPNRVTRAGFWKATGTDRPIYSSEGTKCIGLKKSLVFYRGRAAKGIKTDWMMHEFRLPSLTNSAPPKRLIDKDLPATDSWAICRIFKKTNSMSQRALSQSWVSQGTLSTRFISENISCTTEAGSAIQFCSNNDLQNSSTTSFSPVDHPSYKPINPMVCKPSPLSIMNGDLLSIFMSSPLKMSGPTKCTDDAASMLLNQFPSVIGNVSKSSGSTDFGGMQECNGFPITLTQEIGNMGTGEEDTGLRKNLNAFHANNQWETVQPIGFPSNLPNAWRLNLLWDSPPCPSEMSTSYSTNKCYT